MTRIHTVHTLVLSMAPRKGLEYQSTAMDYSWKCAMLAGCWTGLGFDMDHKLWAMAFTQAILKT